MSRVYVNESVDFFIPADKVTDELRAWITDTGTEAIENEFGAITGIREAYELFAEGFDVMIANIASSVRAGGYVYVEYDEGCRGRWLFDWRARGDMPYVAAVFEPAWDFYGTADDAAKAKALLLEHGWNENRMPEV
jgi:hypothetical protein